MLGFFLELALWQKNVTNGNLVISGNLSPFPLPSARQKKEKKKENNVVYVLQYLSELIPQVDNLCISILRDTSYIKLGFSLPSSTSTRSHLGPTAKRS